MDENKTTQNSGLTDYELMLPELVDKIKEEPSNLKGIGILDKEIKNALKLSFDKMDKGEVSDGYHTFNELYDHRNTMFIALCKSLMVNDPDHYENKIYKTRFDFENKYCGDGWFILGINFPKGKQISYHLPFKYWETCKQFTSFDKVPAFDGHTSKDVLERLLQIPTI